MKLFCVCSVSTASKGGKNIMKQLIISILFTVLCIVVAPAMANANEVRLVTTDTLPMKQSDAADAKTIQILTKGQHVTVLDGSVYANGMEGYVDLTKLGDVIASNIAVYEPTFTILKVKDQFTMNRNGNVRTFEKDAYVYRASSYFNTKISHADDVDDTHLTRIPPTPRASTSKLIVKDGAYRSSNTLLTLPANTVVESYGTLPGGWRIIRYGDTIGFVTASVMNAIKPVTSYVTVEGLALRDRPHTKDGRIAFFLTKGTEVKAYPSAAGWSYVEAGTLGGYVQTDLLVTKKVAKSTTKRDGTPIHLGAVKSYVTKTTRHTDDNRKIYFKHTLKQFDPTTKSYVNATAIQYAGEPTMYRTANAVTFESVKAAIMLSKKYRTTFSADCADNAPVCHENNGTYTFAHSGEPIQNIAQMSVKVVRERVQFMRDDYVYDATNAKGISTWTFDFNTTTKSFTPLATTFVAGGNKNTHDISWKEYDDYKQLINRWYEEPGYLLP